MAKKKTITSEDPLLARLQEFSEEEFTRRCIMPLLGALGYHRVDYFNGPAERGKDILCWRRGDFAELILAVAQVKKYRPAAQADADQTLTTILNQVQQAIDSEVESLEDARKYQPSTVFVFSPFVFDIQAIAPRFESVKRYWLGSVRIVDGTKLTETLRARAPSVIDELMSDYDGRFHAAIRTTLSNEDLLRAIDFRGEKNIEQLFVDLQFELGNRFAKALFQLQPDFKSNISFDLAESEWPSIRGKARALEDIGVQSVLPSVDEIEKEFSIEVINFRSALEQDKRLTDEVLAAEEEREKALIDIEQTLLPLGSSVATAFNELKNARSALEKANSEVEVQELRSEVARLTSNLRAGGTDLLAVDTRVQRADRKLVKVSGRHKTNKGKLIPPKYRGTIDGKKIRQRIHSFRIELAKNIQIINLESGKDSNKIRNLILRCEKYFAVFNSVLDSPIYCKAVGVSELTQVSNSTIVHQLRITVPLAKLLDSGCSLAIFGEAGAGKTTTLQTYVRRALAEATADQLILFIPLGRAVLALAESVGKGRSNVDTELNSFHQLEDCICVYLRELGVAVDAAALRLTFGSKRATLILDGVDEAIRIAPWIVQSIRDLHSRFTKLQLIVSSRVTGHYVEQIPFVGVTLQPMTDGQRKQFIEAWFGNDGAKEGQSLTGHLVEHPALADVVRSPLLLTVLCVLAEHRVPLPDTETMLYEERMKLLLGEHDYKKIRHRFDSHRWVMESVCKALAFKLHKVGRRSARKDWLVYSAFEQLRSTLGREQIEKAVEELVHPGDVLVPMTETGELGFGHLRYQEFLVASFLREDRSVHLAEFVRNDWWAGVLRMLLAMTSSAEWFVKEIAMSSCVNWEVVDAIVSSRPQLDRENLRNIFGQFKRSEALRAVAAALEDESVPNPEEWEEFGKH